MKKVETKDRVISVIALIVSGFITKYIIYTEFTNDFLIYFQKFLVFASVYLCTYYIFIKAVKSQKK